MEYFCTKYFRAHRMSGCMYEIRNVFPGPKAPRKLSEADQKPAAAGVRPSGIGSARFGTTTQKHGTAGAGGTPNFIDAMMKKFLALLSLAMLCGALTASAQRPANKTFSTTHLVDISENAESTESFSLDPSYEMYVTPLVAEIEVLNLNGGKHVTFKGTNRRDGKTGLLYPLIKDQQSDGLFFDFETLKSLVIYDFCRETGADVIVLPQFSIRHATYKSDGVDANGNRYKAGDRMEENGCYIMEVEMLGFPAVYTNFHTAKQSDFWIKESLVKGQVDNSKTRRTKDEVSVRE